MDTTCACEMNIFIHDETYCFQKHWRFMYTMCVIYLDLEGLEINYGVFDCKYSQNYVFIIRLECILVGVWCQLMLKIENERKCDLSLVEKIKY